MKTYEIFSKLEKENDRFFYKKYLLQQNNTNSTNSSSAKLNTTTLIIVVLGSVVFIVILVIIFVCCCKKKNNEDVEETQKMQENQPNEININIEMNNPAPSVNDKQIEEKSKPDNKREESNKRRENNPNFDKSESDRRFLDHTDRNNQEPSAQKSFDFEEHFKNNMDNLDDKDEKLNRFLVDSNDNSKIKNISEIDVQKYQESQKKKERENKHIIPDLVSNFTDNHNEFFSDDSRVQNSIVESIEYNYHNFINDNNLSQLNKQNNVKNSSTFENMNEPNEKKYGKINNRQEIDQDLPNFNYENEKERRNLGKKYTERDLDNYNSNKSEVLDQQKNHNKEENYNRRHDTNKHYDDEYEQGEYEEDEEYEDEEENEKYDNKDKNSDNLKRKIDSYSEKER